MISCCTTVAQTAIISLQDYCSSLPTFFPSMLSLLQPEGSIYWSTSQIMLLLCSQPSGFLSHSEWKPEFSQCPMRLSDVISAATVASCQFCSNIPTYYLMKTFTLAVPLPGMLFPQVFSWPIHPFQPFSEMSPSPWGLPWPPCLNLLPHAHRLTPFLFPLGFVFSTYHDLMHYTFFLFITCLPHETVGSKRVGTLYIFVCLVPAL